MSRGRALTSAVVAVIALTLILVGCTSSRAADRSTGSTATSTAAPTASTPVSPTITALPQEPTARQGGPAVTRTSTSAAPDSETVSGAPSPTVVASLSLPDQPTWSVVPHDPAYTQDQQRLEQLVEGYARPPGSSPSASPLTRLTSAYSNLPEQLSATVFWISPAKPNAVVDFYLAHVSSGFTYDHNNTRPIPPDVTFLDLDFSGPFGRSQADNYITVHVVVETKGAGTGIAITAATDYLPSRSADLYLWPYPGSVVAQRLERPSGRVLASVTITGSGAAQLAQAIDAIPLAPPRYGSCPSFADRIYISLTFTKPGGPYVVNDGDATCVGGCGLSSPRATAMLRSCDFATVLGRVAPMLSG